MRRRSHCARRKPSPRLSLLRIAVYTDYAYTRLGDSVYADRAFALFLAGLAERADGVVIVGRLRPGVAGERARYALPPTLGFVPLPFYETLARPLNALGAMLRSLGRFWRALDTVDAAWLLGPHPLAIVFVALAILHRRKIVLGVRQDLVEYARSRHPDRKHIAISAQLLDAVYRAFARVFPVVVVGPALRDQYGRGRSVLEVAVSLVRTGDIVSREEGLRRRYNGERRLLAVGRIEAEKNPLMLADVLARLSASDDASWRLVVCGEGDLEGALHARLRELGVAEHAEIRGYVPHEELLTIYRSSHVLLHVSWTEGFPQVIVEALAAGLPVVATDVGGIREAVGDAAVLVPPGDVDAAVARVRAVCGDPQLRGRLVDSGTAYARIHTIESETERVARFLADA